MNTNSRDRSAHSMAGKRHRPLFLVVDVLLLAAILAAVFFLAVALTPFDPFGGKDREQRTILYTIELADLDETSLEALRVGDRVIDAATGSEIGEVMIVDSRPYSFYTDVPTERPDEQLNSYVVTKDTRTDRYTVTLTVRVTADFRAGRGYEAGTCRIAVGRTLDLHFPDYAGKGVLVTLLPEGGVQ